jgi:hypothetical protein
MEKAKFTRLSANEVKVEYKGSKFMLVEKNRGVYGAGRAVQLYLMKGFEKEHIKEIGWTKSDGSSSRRDACITDITTFEACKEAAVKYIDLMI